MSCKSSVQTDVHVGTHESAQQADEFDEAPRVADVQPTLRTEYFGIARRMTLRPAQRTATCSCVAAVVGSGDDPNFEWYGDKPDIGPDALVVGVSAEGIPCEHRGRGPSIAAVDREGQDVVIVLEEFKDTRPIAAGDGRMAEVTRWSREQVIAAAIGRASRSSGARAPGR